jgi:hypothetical protein
MGVGAPADVQAAIARARQEAQAREAQRAGVVVGAAEPEPKDNRTVQMDASQIEALMQQQGGQQAFSKTAEGPAPLPPAPAPPVIASGQARVNTPQAFHATLPPGVSPPPELAQGAPPSQQRTMMAPAPDLEALKAQAPAGPQQRTMMAPAPDLSALQAQGPARPQTGPGTVMGAPNPVPPQNQQPTMMAPAPVLPAGYAQEPPLTPPSPQAPPGGQSTMQLEAPQVPPMIQPGGQAPMQPQAQPMVQAQAQPMQAQAQPMMQPQAQPAAQPAQAKSYTPPAKKGSLGSFSRALAFMGQMFRLAGENKTLLKPIWWDLIITTPISIGLAVLLSFVESDTLAYLVLGVGVGLLYFVDYACNALTVSLLHDYATTGEANMANARARFGKAFGGIMVFAAVSAILDVASTYARERNDFVSRIVLRVLRAIWTTATYVIMPSLVLEGVGFAGAFKRSKELMNQDPTGVGAGVVAMSITSYIAAMVIFPLAYFSFRFGAMIHPILGGVLFFLFVNLYWCISGWMKAAYATCFYMWARACEQNGAADNALAPAPLRHALDAA